MCALYGAMHTNGLVLEGELSCVLNIKVYFARLKRILMYIKFSAF